MYQLKTACCPLPTAYFWRQCQICRVMAANAFGCGCAAPGNSWPLFREIGGKI
jgi:hypothetical protein